MESFWHFIRIYCIRWFLVNNKLNLIRKLIKNRIIKWNTYIKRKKIKIYWNKNIRRDWIIKSFDKRYLELKFNVKIIKIKCRNRLLIIKWCIWRRSCTSNKIWISNKWIYINISIIRIKFLNCLWWIKWN